MDLRKAPLLLPAAALAAGALAAFQLSFVSLPALAALVAAGLALGRRAGVCLAFAGLGGLVAAARLDLPHRPEEGLVIDRPVEAVVETTGHWTPDDEGWQAPARALVVRQGERILTPPLALFVHLPDADEPPLFGSRLRVEGYLGRSAPYGNRIPVPPGPWRLRVKSRLLMAVEEGPGPFAALSGVVRRRVERAYAATAAERRDSPGRALARALILGDASGLPQPWRRGLRILGLYHLVAVSGLHVALLSGLVGLAACRLPRPLRLVLMLAAIVLYLLLAGPLPSLLRASVMALLAVSALLAERPPAAANGLAWAVLLMVLARPEIVTQAAFQLTVSATAGLLLLSPELAQRWSWLPPRLSRPLAASVGAQLATLPWSLPRFHLVAPTAPLLNLLAVPWTALALAGSLLWTALALASPHAAAALLPVLDLLAVPFAWTARLRPAPWWTLPLALPAGLVWALVGALLVVLLACRRPLRTAAAVALAALVGWAVVLSRPPVAVPELAMLDVGQGDAILLRDGAHAVLVDGGGARGGDLGGRVLLPALLGEGVRRLDAVVMTHPDNDHCGGLVEIAAYLPVGEVWMSPGWDPAGCAGRLLDLPGVRTRRVGAGSRAAVGRFRLTVLHPELDPGRSRKVNEDSLVVVAEVLGHRVLLTGDVERGGEERLVDCCSAQLRSEVLKVAHHGSRTSSSDDFLSAAAPHLAIVSVGAGNLYHHPSPIVLDRLAEHHVRLLRTDRDGLIAIEIDVAKRLRIELPGAPK